MFYEAARKGAVNLPQTCEAGDADWSVYCSLGRLRSTVCFAGSPDDAVLSGVDLYVRGFYTVQTAEESIDRPAPDSCPRYLHG